jgi:hypothetical protein
MAGPDPSINVPFLISSRGEELVMTASHTSDIEAWAQAAPISS